MYVDRAEVYIEAGKGGNGSKSFRREIYEPYGGPDGGDGGRGGHIIAKVDTGLNTLMDFKLRRKYKAENGDDGAKKNKTGRNGKDIVLYFPQGTVIFEKNTGHLLADLSDENSSVIIAEGGRGGKGNTHYKSSIRQAPDFAQPGKKGDALYIVMELKSIADVGLLGFPNAGKSSLLSVVTKSKPKVADYPFTTLKPNLGVVESILGKSFVMADIPGIIEGASEGVGLGLEFLRHVERTRLLLHLVDISENNIYETSPLERYKIMRRELKNYSERLSEKKEIVFLNKIDSEYSEEELNEIKEFLESNGIEYFLTSIYKRDVLENALKKITSMLDDIPKENLFDDVEVYKREEEDQNINCYIEDGEYVIEGGPVERLFEATDFVSYQSQKRFEVTLKKIGVYDILKKEGIKNGDVVRIKGYAFEYRE